MNAFVKKAIPMHILSQMQLTGNRFTAAELEKHNINCESLRQSGRADGHRDSFCQNLPEKTNHFRRTEKETVR